MEIEKENELDLNLYSRQIGAFGVETMTKLVKMRVLIAGLSGVGLETAKNLILAGPKVVSVWDSQKCQKSDLEYNYYLKQEHVDKQLTRAQAALSDLADLNNYVNVNEFKADKFKDLINKELLEQFDLVIVADFYPLDQVFELNKMLRQLKKGMIATGCLGLFGFCFTDFGEHQIFDKNGEPLKHSILMSIESNGLIMTEDKKRHDLEEGDLVRFNEVMGMDGINGKVFKVGKIISPFAFMIEDLSKYNFGNYERNGVIEEVKQKITMKFNSLEHVLENPHNTMIDCDMDFENMDCIHHLKLLLKIIWKYISQKEIPDFYDNKNLQLFMNELKISLEEEIEKHEKEINDNLKEGEEKVNKKDWMKMLETNVPKLIFALAKGNYSPMHSFYGGIVAQEAVKMTGKFTPINQIFVHEFYSGLFKNKSYEDLLKNVEDIKKNQNSRYLSQIALLGEDLQSKINKSKVFMVGSGALGCEYMKIFAMTGLCCDKEGKLVITDDDNIEVSNLNRQFLFRQKHLQKSKSKISAQVAKSFNPDLNVESKEERVQSNTEKIFTDKFWDELSFIVNAVDNVKARRYVDQKAVFHEKTLFESGTLGTKCNSQLIIPFKTECYSDSQDPQEKQVPMCTMRSFPYEINHCIEWARTKFFDMFVNPALFLHEFFNDPNKGKTNIQKRMKNDMTNLLPVMEYLQYYIDTLKEPTAENFIQMAVKLYQEYFDIKINELLQLFPPDYVDKKGNIFWSSPKRPPTPLPFDQNNIDHQAYVISFMTILKQIFPCELLKNLSENNILDLLKKIKIQKREIKINLTDRQKLTDENAQGGSGGSNDEDLVNSLLIELMEISKSFNISIQEIEFEKDDDNNGHIDFITHFSNYRATNYKIKTIPRHKIKLIAGKIIPAIATSTAMICGAIGIEIYKHFLNVDFEQRRNFFSNLAIPIFSFSEPIPPFVQKDKDYDVVLMGPVKTIPHNWNTWSKIPVQGPKTLKQMIEHIKQLHQFNVSSVVINDVHLWSTFTNNDDYRLDMQIMDLLKEIKYPIYEGMKYVVMSISGELKDMTDVYSPIVKYCLQQFLFY